MNSNLDIKRSEKIELGNEKFEIPEDFLRFDYSKIFIPFSKLIPLEDRIKEINNKYHNPIKKYSEQFKAILKLELFL